MPAISQVDLISRAGNLRGENYCKYLHFHLAKSRPSHKTSLRKKKKTHTEKLTQTSIIIMTSIFRPARQRDCCKNNNNNESRVEQRTKKKMYLATLATRFFDVNLWQLKTSF